MTTPPVAPELPGLTYQRHIGSGGFAEVYLYEQLVTGQKVAVKVLTDDGLDDELQGRFFAEAKTTAELADHPSIVTVYTADITAAGRPYLVMQYYPKPNLAVRCRAKAFGVREVLQIGVQLAGAVETAHRAGILHRDIKPANVLTDAYDAPGLTDFGIAGRSGGAGGSTAEAMSVPWSPPEVLEWLDSDERADVYSLGATLYHLLAGRSPFELKSGPNGRSALIDRIKREPVPDLARDDVPDSMLRLLKQCMAKAPAARPASALALGQALRAIQQEQRIALTPLIVREDEERPAPPVGDEDEGLATRVRPPMVIDPVSRPRVRDSAPPSRADGLTTRPASRATEADTPTAQPVEPIAAPQGGPRVRASHPGAPDLEQTSASRPLPASAIPQDLPEPASPFSTARPLALVALAVLALAVSAGGFALTRSSDGAQTARTTAPAAVTDGPDALAGQGSALAPGIPVVMVVERSAGGASFRWTYDDPQPGDTFLGRRADAQASDGAQLELGSRPAFTITTATTSSVCLLVRVVRTSGLASAFSAVTCS